MSRYYLNRLASVFVRNWKKITSSKIRIKSRRGRSMAKYTCSIVFMVTIIALYGVVWHQRNQKEDELLEQNLLQRSFAGAGNVCDSFLCFGESLCFDKTKVKVKLSYSSAVIENNWFSINGVLINKHDVKHNATFKTPFLCPHEKCDAITPKEMFAVTNYRSSLCQNFQQAENCNVTTTVQTWRRWKKLKLLKGPLDSDVIKGISLPLICATRRLADRIVRRVYDVKNDATVFLRHYNDADKARLLLLCKISPGTVVQRLFPSSEGWPFPRMIGTCGNVFVHAKAVETTLYEVYNKPWKIRLDVAIQLLNLARHMTENDSKFSILLHKLTSHDVGLSVTGRVRIHSSGKVIIVDQDHVSKGQTKYAGKTFEIAFKKKVLSITEREACDVSTDVNYYAICRNLLAGVWNGRDGALQGGLLHHPKELGTFNSKMSVLLDLCIRGSSALPREERSKSSSVRATAAWKLRELLMSARECDARFAYRYPECELINRSSDVYKLPSFELQWLQ